jgi:hypothetical protein
MSALFLSAIYIIILLLILLLAAHVGRHGSLFCVCAYKASVWQDSI